VKTLVRQGHSVRRGSPIVISLATVLIAMFATTKLVHPNFGPFDLESLALVALPLSLAALAQMCIVISGGIDLSLGSLIAISNVLAARLMQDADVPGSVFISLLVLLVIVLASTVNGVVAVFSGIPDVMVTLTTGFIYGGIALLILNQPGGGAPDALTSAVLGGQLGGWLPNAVLFLVVVTALVWMPIRRSRFGLAMLAAGSDRVASLRSGANPGTGRIIGYAVGGLFAGASGLALTFTTGIGSPLGGAFYTLASVAAITLGGVSLQGGEGEPIGPIIASVILAFIPMALIFLNIDPNYGQVIQGAILVAVVVVGGALAKRRLHK
jgi:ribose transport system permease protein